MTVHIMHAGGQDGEIELDMDSLSRKALWALHELYMNSAAGKGGPPRKGGGPGRSGTPGVPRGASQGPVTNQPEVCAWPAQKVSETVATGILGVSVQCNGRSVGPRLGVCSLTAPAADCFELQRRLGCFCERILLFSSAPPLCTAIRIAHQRFFLGPHLAIHDHRTTWLDSVQFVQQSQSIQTHAYSRPVESILSSALPSHSAICHSSLIGKVSNV